MMTRSPEEESILASNSFPDAPEPSSASDSHQFDEITPPPRISKTLVPIDPTAAGVNAESDANSGEPVTAFAQAEQPSQLLGSSAKKPKSHSAHLVSSTLLSLVMVFGLLLLARYLVPPLVENVRYGWYRGQLRAEYELSDQRLRNVSLDSLSDVSQLVSQRVGPSLVHINLLRDEEMLTQYERLLGRSNPNVRYEGQGSGFVIDSAGYILTNHHVVEGVGQIEVTLSDGRQLPAEILGVDPPTDLAVLKVPALDLLPVEWGNSENVVVGTPVWAAGSPFGLQQTVTFGIISGKHRVDFRGTRYEQSVIGGTAYGDLMQSDVALNPGNSGGPLVNSMGEVVGVNAAILGETYRGISFSIPSRVARNVAKHLIEDGEVPRGWLGVRMEDLPLDERYREDGTVIPGVRITGFPNFGSSPARDAGLQVGDLIVEFNGQEVVNQIELMKLIGETEVETRAELVVRRENSRLSYQVLIGKRELSAR